MYSIIQWLNKTVGNFKAMTMHCIFFFFAFYLIPILQNRLSVARLQTFLLSLRLSKLRKHSFPVVIFLLPPHTPSTYTECNAPKLRGGVNIDENDLTKRGSISVVAGCYFFACFGLSNN